MPCARNACRSAGVELELSVVGPPGAPGLSGMPDAAGHSVTNPLFIVYGCFNVL
ncbi:MAG: hypothetical protein ACTHMY_26165 [Solirubrobacteraceae bacterium]